MCPYLRLFEHLMLLSALIMCSVSSYSALSSCFYLDVPTIHCRCWIINP